MRHGKTGSAASPGSTNPSIGEPLIVLIVDELAALTGWTFDREAKSRSKPPSACSSPKAGCRRRRRRGRARPAQRRAAVRDLFPTRIALRLSEAEQVNLVLGPGARNRGALCDQISDPLPGVGYVAVDGIAEPVRVRFSHITDDHIAEIGREPRTAARRADRRGAAA